jgi:hypothetical protein
MSDNRAGCNLKPSLIGVMEAAKSPLSAFLARLAVIAALVTVMLAAAFHLWPRVSFWQQQRLATKLIAELELTANPQIQTVLKQVSSLGNPAIEALVVAAASERADIALAARRIIEERLAAWEIQAASNERASLAEPTAHLAAALAEHVDKFGPFGQQWATRLALDIVDLAADFSVEAAVPVLADCSTVLSAVPALGPRMLTPQEPTLRNESEGIVAALPEVRIPALPYEPLSQKRKSITSVVTEPSIPNDSIGSSRTTEELLRSSELPKNSNWVPQWLAKPDSAALESKLTENADQLPTPVVPGELVDVPSPEEQEELAEELRPLDTRELLAQLQEADPYRTAVIQDVLSERGITAEELAIAAKIFSTDSVERLTLIDDLKMLPARTARRWLRELLVDKDAEVRLKALTALATTNDPELRTIARDVAVRDTDRRVAELASQIMRQTR